MSASSGAHCAILLTMSRPCRNCDRRVVRSLDLNSGPGIYCWRVGGQLIYYLPYFYLPYFISLNVKTVIVQKKEKGEATSLYIETAK